MNCDRANESTGLEARATDSGSPKAQRLEPNNGLDYPQGKLASYMASYQGSS